jgi:hypothetical protein
MNQPIRSILGGSADSGLLDGLSLPQAVTREQVEVTLGGAEEATSVPCHPDTNPSAFPALGYG